MKTVGGRRLMKNGRGPWIRLLLLALGFLAGLFLGQVLARQVGGDTSEELTRYLTGYFSLEQPPELSAKTIFSILVVYFRYPLLAFLLGFSSVGIVLLPLVSVAYGFFLSFSVCCFTAAFGHSGVLLALAVFGMRCAIALPCYFALAVPALEKSVALASFSLNRGARLSPPAYGRAWWVRFGAVAAVLATGVLVEMLVSPRLLSWVLQAIFR